MSASSAPYFFISYSRADSSQQQDIIRELRARGVDVWVDTENLIPGSHEWEREIERSIRGSKGVIVLLTPDSNDSEWVRREISFAEENKKRMFPVLVRGNEDDSVPLRLSSHQRVDLRRNYDNGLDQLSNALKRHAGIKVEDATRVHRAIPRKTQSTQGSFDLKRFAIPGAIVLLGLFCIGGIALAINLLGNPDTPTGTATETVIDRDMTPTPADINGPTGKIVYTCQVGGLNDNEICIMDADGSNWRQLTDSGFTSYYASLSPDGQSIVFVNNQTNHMSIYEMDLSGNISLIRDLNSDLAAPEISPDNQYIAFTNNVDGFAQIWIMNRDGSNPHKLYGASSDALDPTWSPDGTKLLFAVGEGERKQLYTMNLTGGEPGLVSGEVRTRGRSDWSSLDLLTYYSNGPWEREVFVIHPDGTGLRQITNGGNSQGPSFSPDGNWVAFTAYTDVPNKHEESCEIFIMDLNGSNLRQLTDNGYCDYQPRWGN